MIWSIKCEKDKVGRKQQTRNI